MILATAKLFFSHSAFYVEKCIDTKVILLKELEHFHIPF